MSGTVICIESLYSGYGKHEILHDINFEAGNEVTGIVGSNGSGKSTLIKSICGLCDIRSGRIALNGTDITGRPTHSIMRNDIAYMPQTNNVFSDLSVLDNLRIANMPDAPDWDRIYGFFPTLRDTLHKKAGEFSGGQRQMLAMAMCISRNPGIILFDEPTASLSPAASGAVLEKIKEIQAGMGNCVVLVEQNVRGGLAISDRCYLLAGGRKVFEGTPEDLLSDKDFNSKFLGVQRDDNPS